MISRDCILHMHLYAVDICSRNMHYIHAVYIYEVDASGRYMR